MIPGAALNLDCPVNWAHPLNRGRVAWWLAHPSIPRGNTWHELCGMSSKRAFDGTLTNFATPGAGWKGNCGRPGGYGSLSLDGTNDFVSLPTAVFAAGSNPWTFAGWVRPTSTASMAVAGRHNALTASGSEWYLQVETLVPKLNYYISTSSHVLTSSTSLTSGRWYWIACGYTGTDYFLFSPGLFSVTATAAGTNATSAASRLGIVGAILPLAGSLDDCAMYNRNLSSAELITLYQQSRLGHPETLNWI